MQVEGREKLDPRTHPVRECIARFVILFDDGANPSCASFEALGAERAGSPEGAFHRDVRPARRGGTRGPPDGPTAFC
jgi:hypothetical protein